MQVCDSGLCAEEAPGVRVGGQFAKGACCSALAAQQMHRLQSWRPDATVVKRSTMAQLLCRCRSEYSDDFQDARGFGWEIPGQPKFHWKTLIQKKVLAREVHEHVRWWMSTAFVKLVRTGNIIDVASDVASAN